MRALTRFEEFEDEAGRLVRYRRRDGGGLVADADVAQDAQVGVEAWIDPRARVLAGARVGTRTCLREPWTMCGHG